MHILRAMGKADISLNSHTLDEIEAIVSEFEFGSSSPPEPVVERFSKLFGGYSASNYKVEVRAALPHLLQYAA